VTRQTSVNASNGKIAERWKQQLSLTNKLVHFQSGLKYRREIKYPCVDIRLQPSCGYIHGYCAVAFAN